MSENKETTFRITPSRDESNCLYPMHIEDYEHGGCDRLSETLVNVCNFVMEDNSICNNTAFVQSKRGELFCEDHAPEGSCDETY